MDKPSAWKEPLLVKLIEGIFIQVPLAGAGVLLTAVGKIKILWLKRLILGVFILVPLALIFGLWRFLNALEIVIQTKAFHPGLELIIFFLVYLLATLPIFLFAAHMNRTGKFFKESGESREPDPDRMWWHRFRSDYHKVYLGHGMKMGRPIYLTNNQRQLHCEVVGSTGTGKTESVLLPMLAHDIAHKKGAIIIDGKSDLELRNKIRYIVHENKRDKDFLFFSLAHPGKSNTYNPLLSGNPTELKDKLVNSTAWSEEFYRRMAEQAALTLLNAIHSTGNKATFRKLYSYLTDLNALSQLSKDTKDLVLKEDIGKMVSGFKDNRKFLAGLMSDLFLTSRSEFSELLNTEKPEINLQSVYEDNKICYFSLDLQKYADTSKRLGRMIIQDIRAVSSNIQSKITSLHRHFFPVFIDDATSFLELNFIDFLNKCRASGFAVTILHQSPADLVYRGAPNFREQVIENSNIKIILRQDDPNSIDKFTKIAGTRRTMISTYQTQEQLLGKGLTGAGSVREGQTFRIDPDLIRSLKLGEAVVIWKYPSLFTEHVKLDFFGYSSRPDEPAKPALATNGKKDKNKEEPARTLNDKDPVPDEVNDPLEFINQLSRNKPAAGGK